MNLQAGTSRRGFLTGGGAVLTALAVGRRSEAQQIRARETKVVFLVGDYWHNPITQEKNWREILGPTGWRLMFARSTRAVTPALLSDTDLFVVARYAKTNNLGYGVGEIVERLAPEEQFLMPEREKAIIDNVHRGMGLLAMHCTVWNGEKPDFMTLLGIETPYMHTKVQPTTLHKLNPAHPITAGVATAPLGEDEIFRADLIPGKSTVLFNLTGEEQPIDTAGGWCHDEGKGRVTVLLPGHTPHPFHSASFKAIMWRSAYWTMRRDIPDMEFVNGRPAEQSLY